MDMSSLQYDPGSFRDPESRVFHRDGRVFRALSPRAAVDLQALISTDFFRRAVTEGRVVETEWCGQGVEGPAGFQPWSATLQHERVPLVTYPYEWSFGMLRDAALLQLDLHLEALESGFTLKDASPFNIQWRGVEPVFIDVGSFERARPAEPWIGYRQFCQLYLYPLWLTALRGLAHQPWLRARLEGVTPEEFRHLLSLRDLFRPGVLAHGILLPRLSARYAGATRDVRGELADAGFGTEMIGRNLRSLRRLVAGLSPGRGRSQWSHYEEESCPYPRSEMQTREEFVRSVLARAKPAVVWDAGCNTGRFSRLAAEYAALVVAFDSDAVAVERLYRALKDEGERRILPLVCSATETHGAAGWMGRERPALVDRGRPDVLLVLAVVHHLAITGYVPIPEIVAWAADLAPELVIEFVGREDPMVERLLGGRGDRFPEYRQDRFEACLEERFEVRGRKAVLGGGRVLYHAVRRP